MNTNKIKICTDSYGYLINLNDWNEKFALHVAKSENIILTEIHWDVIKFIRLFYIKFNILPTMRILVKEVKNKHGHEKGNSRYLFKIFPKIGPFKLGSKIAGLPRPIICL